MDVKILYGKGKFLKFFCGPYQKLQQKFYSILLQCCPSFDVSNDGQVFYIPIMHHTIVHKTFTKQGYNLKYSDVCKRKIAAVNKLYDYLDRVKKCRKVNLKLKGFIGELYPFQTKAVAHAAAVIKRFGGVINSTFCVDGEAIVNINRAKNGKKYKIKTVYEKFNGLTKKDKWNKEIPTYIRCMYNGELRIKKLLAAYYNGKKEVVEIKLEDGKKLKLTKDHQVYTDNGWIEINKLNIGDYIYTNGIQKCKICNSTEKIVIGKNAKYRGYCHSCFLSAACTKHKDGRIMKDGYIYIRNGLKYHPNLKSNNGIAKHRLIKEAALNNLSLEQWLNTIKRNSFNKNHKFLSTTLQVHHKDGNKLNNNIDNLICYTPQHHSKTHKTHKNFPIFFPKKTKIISIENAGIIDVYDFSVEEAQSYVANGVIVHNCGGGKSPEAIATLCLLNANKTLIVVPASVKLQWLYQVLNVFAPHLKVKLIDSKQTPKYICPKNPEKTFGLKSNRCCICEKYFKCSSKITPSKLRKSLYEDIRTNYDVLLINYEMLRIDFEHIRNIHFDFLLLDEASKVKNAGSKIAKRIKKLKIKYRMLLTGTPVENRLEEICNLLSIANPDITGTQANFRDMFCIQDFFGTVIGYRNVEIFRELVKPFLIRKRITDPDVCIQLPPLQMNNRIIELGVDHYKIYKDAKKGTLEEINACAEKINTASVIAKISYLTSIADSSEIIGFKSSNKKLSELIDIINNEIDNQSKIIVFTRFAKVAKILERELNASGISTSLVTGQCNPIQKEQIVSEFSNNKKRALISTECLAYGKNMQFANYIINYDVNWNPAILEQKIKRLYRIGQTKPVFVINLISKDTIEEKIYNTLYKKLKVAASFIDGEDNISVEMTGLKDLIKIIGD